MEIEENGCDASPSNERTKLIFTSEENTRDSDEAEASKETDSEMKEETEVSKMDINMKEIRNLKAKNDIEDDIRMICGSEELNRSSQEADKASVVEDNNILETLEHDKAEQNNETPKSRKNEGQPKAVLKRTHSHMSSIRSKDNEDQDLFGFYEGKFVFGKKAKINSHDLNASEIIEPKYKRMKSTSESNSENNDPKEKNEKDKTEKSIVETEDVQSNKSLIINEKDASKTTQVAAAISPPHVAPTAATPSTQKLKPSEDPTYRKPFELGWKREIVLRALPGSKDKGEVYYITPAGKKLRTRHEIQVNLTPGLTLENFTFSKDPLGADPEDEIIRSAKPSGRTSEVSTPKISEISTPTSSKRVPKPKGPKGASPPPQGWTSTHAVKTQGSRSHSRHPIANTDNEHSTPKTSKGTPNAIIGESVNMKSNSANKKVDPCTIECVLAMGLIPQIQCVKCLSLYHHECIGLDRNNDSYKLGSVNDSGNKGKKVYECDSCKAQSSSIKTDLSTLSNSETSNELPQKSISQNSNSNGSKTISSGRNSAINLNSKLASDNINSSSTYQEKDILSRSGSKNSQNQANNKNVNASENNKNLQASLRNISPKHAQSIAVLNGRKYLVIHKPGIPNTNEHNESLSSPSHKSSPVKVQYIDSYVHNLFGNVSAAYDIILNVFRYLKVQELLRAACVSRLWNHLANERSLWKVVRMKNSQVNDWAGFAATLSRNSTQHLDLRKMICPKSGVDKMWTNFNENIQKVFTLKTIDLGRCPAVVVQNLFLATPQLKILNATSIKSETINLENLNKLSNLTELRLKSVERCNLIGDLSSFAFLKDLKHLSLTSINELGTKNIEILGNLTELESLEIGECSTIKETFASEVLANLKNLQRLRLEKTTEVSVTFSILDQIAEMENLQQLELVNFDIREGFEQKIIACIHLKRFLLIPTYVSQSATTNQIILSSMRKLRTLESFTWVVTLELLSVTALYVDQCGSRDRRNFNDCIPVLKPVPGAAHREKDDVSNKSTNADIQQIEILPLSTIKEILDDGAPTTKHKIVRAAYATTWRQTFVE